MIFYSIGNLLAIILCTKDEESSDDLRVIYE